MIAFKSLHGFQGTRELCLPKVYPVVFKFVESRQLHIKIVARYGHYIDRLEELSFGSDSPTTPRLLQAKNDQVKISLIGLSDFGMEHELSTLATGGCVPSRPFSIYCSPCTLSICSGPQQTLDLLVLGKPRRPHENRHGPFSFFLIICSRFLTRVSKLGSTL